MTVSKIRMARIARGLSQLRLAKKVRSSQTAICLIERGELEPDERLKRRLARILSQPAETLFKAAADDEDDE